MSLWLTIAIYIMWALWSIVEVHGLHVLNTNRFAYYTRTSRMVTILWIVFTIFWFSFQIFG
jgi:hypothetical protein